MDAIILAAGRGSRLGDLNTVTSKGALPLLGKSLVARVHEMISGLVDRVLVVVNPEDTYLLEELSGERWAHRNIEVCYQREPLGSADALRVGISSTDKPCLVTACDNLLDRNFVDAFIDRFNTEQPDALVAITTFEERSNLPSSVIAMDENATVKRIIEKPSQTQLISDFTALPLYAFQPSFVHDLSSLRLSTRNEFEIPQAIQNLIDRGGVVRGMLAESRITINSPFEYGKAVKKLLDETGEIFLAAGAEIAFSVDLKAPVYVEAPVQIDSQASIGPGVYIMPDCAVGRAAVVRESILFRGSRVSPGAYVSNKLVLPGDLGAIDLQKSHGSRGQARHR